MDLPPTLDRWDRENLGWYASGSGSGLQYVDDAADEPTAINTGNSTRVRREKWLKPGELFFREPEIAVCHSGTPNM